MPLNKSGSKASIGENISTLRHEGRKESQSVAIALDIARRAKRAAGGAVNISPSDAQKEAGNYKKSHVVWNGLDISIENQKGSTRSGTGPDGKPWSVKMPDHYGYIKRTEGADGDHVDVYLGPDKACQTVYVVDQVDHRTRRFDEHKAMLGYCDRASALDAYRRAFSDGKGAARVGAVTELSVDGFKAWLRGNGAKKPMGTVDAIIRRATGGSVPHVGSIHSAVGGRTDHLALDVPAGSYVIPADIVSGLGQGNTQAGLKILERMVPAPAVKGKTTPIMAAGGEYVVPPEEVVRVGGGDMDKGHNVLDAFVKAERKKLVKTLVKLPGPSR